MVIRVHAAGVNPFDQSVMAGYLQGMMEHRFPLVPGVDAAGVVEAVGPASRSSRSETRCSVSF